MTVLQGPFFDELRVGDRFSPLAPTPLSEALCLVHGAIVGNWLPAAQPGAHLAPGGATIVSPSLVWDTAIGHSTVATREVRANLFYRSLAFHRFPVVGDVLSTQTEVVALKGNRPRAGRAATGMAVLRVTTSDQLGRLVLDFLRCAMLPDRQPCHDARHRVWPGPDVVPPPAADVLAGWTVIAQAAPPEEGAQFLADADVVTNGPELARLTKNTARVHHDDRVTGRRLVYGGHTIGLAFAQACRALPQIVVPLSWSACDHHGPVFEGDTVTSRHTVVGSTPGPAGGRVLTLRTTASASSQQAAESVVLDWTWTALTTFNAEQGAAP